MRALTLWPEWAWAICKLGKNVENRSRTTHILKPGDQFAIHAGAHFGGTRKYKKIARVFAPVSGMAQRAGWRMGETESENVISGYSIVAPYTFREKVHQIPKAGVVAIATFGGLLDPSCVPCNSGRDWPWWDNLQYGYIISTVHVLPTPIPCRGQQGLWTLSNDIEAAVSKQNP